MSNNNNNNHESIHPESTEEITLVHFWVDFMHERSASSDALNSEEMAGKVVEQLVGGQLQLGQLIAPVRFRGKVLQLVVKDITVQDRTSFVSGECPRVEVGQLTDQSTVIFSVIPGSRLQLTGSALYRSKDSNHAKSTLKGRFFTNLLPRRFTS